MLTYNSQFDLMTSQQVGLLGAAIKMIEINFIVKECKTEK